MENKTIIFEEFFYILTVAMVVFVGLELLWPGVVLAYININVVLLFWLIFGIMVLRKGSKSEL